MAIYATSSESRNPFFRTLLGREWIEREVPPSARRGTEQLSHLGRGLAVEGDEVSERLDTGPPTGEVEQVQEDLGSRFGVAEGPVGRSVHHPKVTGEAVKTKAPKLGQYALGQSPGAEHIAAEREEARGSKTAREEVGVEGRIVGDERRARKTPDPAQELGEGLGKPRRLRDHPVVNPG